MRIKLLPHQYKAIYSPYKHTLLSGGVGSGKTFAGTQFIIKNLSEQPETIGLIVANTYQQLKDVSVAALIDQFETYKIPHFFNKNEMTITVGNSLLLCRSAENHVKWKGIEAGYYWMDEGSYAHRQAYETMIARLRHPKAKRHHGIITTTPKGYNWLYSYFVGDKKTEEHHIITAATRFNKHLPKDFEDSIRSQYDDLLAKQEIEGVFINVTAGKIYYAFERENHVKECNYKPRFPVFVGVDFNVNPMTGVAAQLVQDAEGKQQLNVIDEFYLRHSNTEALGKEIIGRYGTNTRVIPDSTGIKRTTNASMSDIQILKSLGLKVEVSTNPYRIDRYAAVNGAFSKGKVVIDPKCQYTIKDLEQVSYKEGTDQPDTSDKMLTHISDALGYMVYKIINPLRGQTKPIQSQVR